MTAAVRPRPGPELYEEAAEMMRAIAHPIRLRILEILQRLGEANVTALCDETGAAQPVVSQQLSRLRHSGVLATRREGALVFYRVARPEALGVLTCMRQMGDRARKEGR